MNKYHLKSNLQQIKNRNMGLALLRSLLALAILAGFVFYSAPAIAAPLFIDGDFSDWKNYKATSDDIGAVRLDKGGIGDSAYLNVTAASTDDYPSAVIISVKDTVIYNPSKDGAISTVSFAGQAKGVFDEDPSEFDLGIIVPGIFQLPEGESSWDNAIFYTVNLTLFNFEAIPYTESWGPYAFSDRTSDSLPNPNGLGLPDFSPSGGAMKFGISAGIQYGSAGISQIDLGIDDFQVTVNPVPIPSAVFLLGSALIGIVGLRRRFVKS